jgi:hypothetical protein
MRFNRPYFGTPSTQSLTAIIIFLAQTLPSTPISNWPDFRPSPIPVATAPVSNRQFSGKLARLETPPNPYKTNAGHDF